LVRSLWLSLAILDLLLIYGIYVRISRILGFVVIADRYLLDTKIDFQLNFPQVNLDRWTLWKCLSRITPEPDASFLLVIPVEKSLERSAIKGEPFPDTEGNLRKRLELYEKLSSVKHLHVIDCLQSIDEVHEDIKRHLNV
jgi:thymidylate kinase